VSTVNKASLVSRETLGVFCATPVEISTVTSPAQSELRNLKTRKASYRVVGKWAKHVV
jgi:hypothetical protein